MTKTKFTYSKLISLLLVVSMLLSFIPTNFVRAEESYPAYQMVDVDGSKQLEFHNSVVDIPLEDAISLLGIDDISDALLRIKDGDNVIWTTANLDIGSGSVSNNLVVEAGKTYVIEIKNYDDPENPRPFKKYDDYMLDHDKVANIKEKAKREGRIPLVIVYFYDYTIVWNVSKIDIDSRANWRWVNKDGQDYGEKELAYETYLYESEILWKETREETERRLKS